MSFIITHLSDITTFIKRGVSPKYVEDDGDLILNKKCIRDGRVSLEPAKLTNRNARTVKEKILQNGDLLVNSTGTGTLGRTAPFFYSDDIEQVLVDTHITIVRPDKLRVNSHYLAYLLRLSELEIINLAKGATNQKELSSQDLGELVLSLIDRGKQDRIASILSNYDKLIDNNRRRIQLLEDSARLLYREWFVHLRFPGHEHAKIVEGVPEGWQAKRVDNVSEYINRGISPNYDDDGEYLVINQKCIRNRLLNLDLARRQSKEYKEEKAAQLGDILINSTGTGTLGRVAQIWIEVEKTTVDSHVTIVRPNTDIPYLWLGYTLMSLEKLLEDMGEGATNQKELSRARIREIAVCLPPKSIMDGFHGFVLPLVSQIQILLQQNKKLVEARDLLLPRLMNGEISV